MWVNSPPETEHDFVAQPEMVTYIKETIEAFTNLATNKNKYFMLARSPLMSELLGLYPVIQSLDCIPVVTHDTEDPGMYCLYIHPIKGKRASTSKPKEYPEAAKNLAVKLGECIEEAGWSVAASAPTSKKWLDACVKVLEYANSNFNHTYDQVIMVVEATTQDLFWSQNVRSPDKLLKHYDRLIQLVNTPSSVHVSQRPQYPTGARASALEEGIAKAKQGAK